MFLKEITKEHYNLLWKIVSKDIELNSSKYFIPI